MSVACPACQSPDVRRLHLSNDAAPPETRRVGGLSMGMVIGAFFILGGTTTRGAAFMFGLVLAGFCGYRLKQALDFNGNEFPGLFRTWENTFVCDRCGERFVPRELARAIAKPKG